MVSSKPSTLRVELTNHCNLRCKMCGIWADSPKRIVRPPVFEQILAQPSLSRIRVISLTGGEPFMLHDLYEYYRIARRVRPRAHINISTNGFYTDETIAFLERTEPGAVSITISYDGVKSHDTVRGAAGSAARLRATAVAVRDRFPRTPLSLKLTVNNENYAEIWDTAQECRALAIPFRFKTLEKLKCHQNRYPSEITGPDYSAEVRASVAEQAGRVLGDGRPTNRRYLTRLISKCSGAPTPCACSPQTLFVGVDGEVFLCRKHDPIGNVFRTPLEAIWHDDERKRRVEAMRRCAGDPMELSYSHD